MRSFLVAAALVLGCPAKQSEPPPSAGPVSPNAPMDLEKPDQSRVALDLANVRAAIRVREQVEGAKPKSIAELGLTLSFEADLEYDPATGTVRSKTYPQL
jgi:hypothetical protein